jgi:predicted DCC family thiol-disulfide oxidoreductase YuxK
MRTTVFFDGRCPWCRRGAKVLASLDWLGRLDLADLTQRSDEELPVAREAAMRGMPVRTASGVGLWGWPAVRAALLQTPLGFVPAVLLGLPGISLVTSAVYNAVAARRPRNASCGIAVRSPFGANGPAGQGTMPA